VNAFGDIYTVKAFQQAIERLEAEYLSGRQVAADGTTSQTMTPDQSLYAYVSGPWLVLRIINTF
jgi:isocitrate lyase